MSRVRPHLALAVVPLLTAVARPLPPAPETFDWSTSLSAPAGAPMGVVAGAFFAGSEPMSGIPMDMGTHGGWGRSSSAYVGGPDRKRAPDRLEVTFYSWLEDRFYDGTFDLPRERIAQLFRDDRAHGKDAARDLPQDLTVGVAPGGAVAVWVGTSDRTTEVFFGHAKPVTLDWHKALDIPAEVDRRKTVEDELAEDARGDPLVRPMRARVPIGRWDAYRTRYRWRLRFEGVPDPSDAYVSGFVNGEADRSWKATPFGAAAGSVGPAPEQMMFTSRRLDRRWEFVLDDGETSAAFARAAAGADAGGTVELVAAVPPPDAAGGKSVTLSVRGAGASVPLARFKVDLFSAR